MDLWGRHTLALKHRREENLRGWILWRLSPGGDLCGSLSRLPGRCDWLWGRISGNTAPDAKTTFAYFGLVGVDDFNFGEMWLLEKRLSQLPMPYQFQTFSGGHEWPPPEKIEQAIAWLTFLAMKSGLTAKDGKVIEDQFASRMAAADQLLAATQYVDAQKAFSSIVRDFQDLRDVKSVLAKLNQLNDSDELKKEIKTEEELYRRQLRDAGEIEKKAHGCRRQILSRPLLLALEATSRLADWREETRPNR